MRYINSLLLLLSVGGWVWPLPRTSRECLDTHETWWESHIW